MELDILLLQKNLMKLFEFPHSHYCEKARWALDCKNIHFETITVMPGVHLLTVPRFAPGSSLPVLLSEEHVIQGSSEIIDFLECHYPVHPLTPTDPVSRKECEELEKEMDIMIGIPLRQIFYHKLLEYPDFISYCFTHPLSIAKRWAFRSYYPILKKKM